MSRAMGSTAPAVLAMAVLAVALPLRTPAQAAPRASSIVLPGDLAEGGEELRVSRRKKFLIPDVTTNEVLVFAPYAVNEYRTTWATSFTHSWQRGGEESQDARSKRSFTFALQGGTSPLLVDCEERGWIRARSERRGEPPPAVRPEHELRCTLHVRSGGLFELSAVDGRGELRGTGGVRIGVSALGASSRWEEGVTTGLLLRDSSGTPVGAVELAGKGRVVLQRDLEPARRELLAAAAAALLLADLARE